MNLFEVIRGQLEQLAKTTDDQAVKDLTILVIQLEEAVKMELIALKEKLDKALES